MPLSTPRFNIRCPYRMPYPFVPWSHSSGESRSCASPAATPDLIHADGAIERHPIKYALCFRESGTYGWSSFGECFQLLCCVGLTEGAEPSRVWPTLGGCSMDCPQPRTANTSVRLNAPANREGTCHRQATECPSHSARASSRAVTLAGFVSASRAASWPHRISS